MSEYELVIPAVSPVSLRKPAVDAPDTEPVAIESPGPEYNAMRRVGRWAGRLAVGGAIAIPTFALGAYTALANFPAPVDAGPGITAEASLIHANYSSVEYGPTFGVPKLHTSIGGFNIGINLDVKEVNASQHANEEQVLESFVQDPNRTLVPEVEDALIWRAGEGGGSAVIAAGAIGFGMNRRRRRRQEEGAENDRQVSRLEKFEQLTGEEQAAVPQDILKDGLDELAVRRQKKQGRESHKLRRRFTAVAACVGVLATSAAVAGFDSHIMTPPSSSRSVIFSKDSSIPYVREIVADEPILDGAFVTGYIGRLGKEGFIQIAKQMERVNEYWREQATNLTNIALPEFMAKNDLSWLNDPNWVGFVDVTDIHDKRPYMQYFLAPVLQALVQHLGAKFLTNTGDQENFSDESVLDKGAQQRLVDDLPQVGPDGKPMEEVFAPGNHDPLESKSARKASIKINGKTYHPIFPLDGTNGYTTTIDGITFVGAPDLNRTTGPHGTKPASSTAQLANDAKQGNLLAQKACDVYERTNQKPIVLAHEPEMGYASVVSGCAALVLNGHWHQELPLKAYVDSHGTITYQQVQGSASGDGPNDLVSIYNKATTTGVISVWYENKVTGELREITISLDPNGAVPTLNMVAFPKSDQATPAIKDPNIRRFAHDYDPSLLTQANATNPNDIAEGHH